MLHSVRYGDCLFPYFILVVLNKAITRKQPSIGESFLILYFFVVVRYSPGMV